MSINSNLTRIISDSTSIEIVADYINKIIKDGKNYGRSDYGNGKRVNIEYTPFSKELDFNTVRVCVYGDCLSNIMSFAGYDVTREFYIKTDDNDIEEIKKKLDKIRVNFDVFTEEQTLYDNGLIDVVLSKLQRSDKCYISEDNLWLKTTDLYDTKDRVLINGDGTYSYLLPEIAYHIDKFNRKNDKVIDIFDSRHRCIDGIKSGIEIAGYSSDKLEIRIIDNNNSKNIDLNVIIDKMGLNALRYYLASIYDGEIDIYLTKMNSMDNPFHYIENAYAKICSLLRGKSYEMADKYSTIVGESAYTILNKLIEFVDIAVSACNGNINIICNYLYELASLFYNYEKEIAGVDNKYIKEKFLLLSAIRTVMNNAASMLGLILREEI